MTEYFHIPKTDNSCFNNNYFIAYIVDNSPPSWLCKDEKIRNYRELGINNCFNPNSKNSCYFNSFRYAKSFAKKFNPKIRISTKVLK